MLKKIVPILIAALLLLSCVACKMEATVPPFTMLTLLYNGEYMHSALYQDELPEAGAEFPAVVIKAEKDGEYFGEYTSPQIDNKKQIGEIRLMGGPGDQYMELTGGVVFTLKYYENAESEPIVLSDIESVAGHAGKYPKYKTVEFDFSEKKVSLINSVDR